MQRHRGFTLIELVMVVVIVGALAIYALPQGLDALRGWNELGFRDQVKSTLGYARSTAVSSRRFVCVAATASGTGLQVNYDPRDPDALTAATANCSATLVLPGSASNSIAAPTSVVLTLPAAAVVFDPLGRAFGPASDCSPSSTTQYCYSVQETGSAVAQIVRVERQTGYVH